MLGRSAVEFHPSYVSNTAIILNLAIHNICEISLPINLGDGSPTSEFCPFDFFLYRINLILSVLSVS